MDDAGIIPCLICFIVGLLVWPIWDKLKRRVSIMAEEERLRKLFDEETYGE